MGRLHASKNQLRRASDDARALADEHLLHHPGIQPERIEFKDKRMFYRGTLPGVIRTSNALKLLQQVGIEVEDDPVLTTDSPAQSEVESAQAPGSE